MNRLKPIRCQPITVWLLWLLAAIVIMLAPSDILSGDAYGAVCESTGVILAETPGDTLFPWWPRRPWRNYALIAYQTAWLKAHYPAEYMAAVISSVMGTKDKVPFFISRCEVSNAEYRKFVEHVQQTGESWRFLLAISAQACHPAYVQRLG